MQRVSIACGPQILRKRGDFQSLEFVGRAVGIFSNSPAARSVGSCLATTRVRHVGLLHREHVCGWKETASIAADGPTFDALVLSAQARHTARLSGKYETECPLYGQEGSKRSEGRAVRPTWRTREKASQINALSCRWWGNCRGIPYIPLCIPHWFCCLRALRRIGQALCWYRDPLNISAHTPTDNRTRDRGGASHLS